jgi:4-hydroxymandelate oxidase
MSALDEFVAVADFEAAARERMDSVAFDYYAGGSGSERTLAENCQAFDRIALRPRMLAGASTVELATSLFNDRLSWPVGLAPTAFNALGHPDGELCAARAAGARGTLMCGSTIASYPLEDIAAASSGPLWFQLYVYRDREVTRDLVRRAEDAGYRALLLTVDTPRLGRRERDVRNRFVLPTHVRIRNLERYAKAGAAGWNGESSFTEYVHRFLDPGLSWESVEWLRSISRLPVLVKGILTAEDADLAFSNGASGVVVSNHGGRQLDGAIATIDALPEIVDIVAGRGPVLLDGGIRRGTDVLKALALGASAVLIGRPYLWGLATAGEQGVGRVLDLLRAELELAMALSGCPTVSGISRALVRRVGHHADR